MVMTRSMTRCCGMTIITTSMSTLMWIARRARDHLKANHQRGPNRLLENLRHGHAHRRHGRQRPDHPFTARRRDLADKFRGSGQQFCGDLS